MRTGCPVPFHATHAHAWVVTPRPACRIVSGGGASSLVALSGAT
jgi:hypothetical protein